MDTTSYSLRGLLSATAGLAVLAGSLATSDAQTPGTVLLNYRAAYLTDNNGDAFGQTDDKLVVFVADLNGDGIAPPTMDSFAPGSDDFVFGSLGTTFDTGGTAVLGGVNLFANTPLFPDGPTIATGDAFAMFWYPELSQQDYLDVDPQDWAGLMPGDTAYGAYNTAESTLDPSWNVPNPPSAEDYQLFTTDVPGVGNLDPSVLQAQFTTAIPEPSSTLLVLIGGLLFTRRRR